MNNDERWEYIEDYFLGNKVETAIIDEQDIETEEPE